MKNYGNQFISIIIVFVLTLLLNFGLEKLTSKDGTIAIQTIELKQGTYIAEIRIENYSKHAINDIKLIIPKAVDISEISSSTAIQLKTEKENLSNTKQKVLITSLIPARQISTIIIPLSSTDNCCSIVNLDEKKLINLTDVNVVDPSVTALIDGLQSALIYTIFFTIIIFYNKAQTNELMDQLEKTRDSVDELKDESDKQRRKLNKKINDIDKRYARKKAILLRRVSDYSKELTFWRDTIRKVLYQNNHDKHEADNIISTITAKLGTYGTRGKLAEDFDTIEALSQHMVDFEKDNSKPD